MPYDLFQQHQPNYLSNMPGGFAGQFAAGGALDVAQRYGMINGPLMDYQNNSFRSMEALQQQLQQQQLMQHAAAQQAVQSSQVVTSMLSMAGRQVTPAAQNTIDSSMAVLMPMIANSAVQSQGGRQFLDMFSTGGVSPTNVAAAVSNMTWGQTDPFTGRQVGPQLQSAIADQLTTALRSRPYALDGQTLAGPALNMGFQGAQLMQSVSYLDSNGFLPSMDALMLNASSSARQSAVDRGLLASGDYARAGMSARDRTLSAFGLITPEANMMDLATDLGTRYNLSDPGVMDGYRAEVQAADVERDRANALTGARAYDDLGREKIMSRVNNYRSRYRKAAANVGEDPGLLRSLTETGLQIGLEHSPFAESARGMLERAGYKFSWDKRESDAESLAALQAEFGADESLGMTEFNRRLLKLGAVTGSQAGLADTEVGQDLANALTAINNDDSEAYRKTRYSQLSSNQKMNLMGRISSIGREDLYAAVKLTPESMLDQEIAAAGGDLFNASAAGNFDADQRFFDANSNQLPGLQVRGDMAKRYVESLKGPLRNELEMLAAVRDLVTDPDLKRNQEELIKYTNEILQGSRNQMSGQQASMLVSSLTTLAQTSGIGVDGLRQLAGVGGQIASSSGLERAYAPRVTEQLLLANKMFGGGEGMGINRLGSYGSMNQAELAQDRAQAFADIMKSDSASAAGTLLRLQDRAGGRFTGSNADFMNQVAQQLDSGQGGSSLDRFMQMSAGQQRAALQQATGMSEGRIMNELTLDMASQGRLQETGAANALSLSAQRSFLRSELAPALDYLADPNLNGIGSAIVRAADRLTPDERAGLLETDARGVIAANAVFNELDNNMKQQLVREHGSLQGAVKYLNQQVLPSVTDQYLSRTGRPLTEIFNEFGGDAAERERKFSSRNEAQATIRSLFSDEPGSAAMAQIIKLAEGKPGSLSEAFTSALGIAGGRSFKKVQEVEKILRQRHSALSDASAAGDANASEELLGVYREALDSLQDITVNDTQLQKRMRAIFDNPEFSTEEGGKAGESSKVDTIKLENVTIELNGEPLVKNASGSSRRSSRAPLNSVSE